MSSQARRESWLRYDRKRRGTNHRLSLERARGVMRRVPKSGVCEECGASGVTVWHHENYDRPRDAIELCHRCHRAKHSRPMPRERLTDA